MFTTTADERWALGAALFLETHVPVRLRRYHPREDWSEDDVLDALLSPWSAGNRVFATPLPFVDSGWQWGAPNLVLGGF
jgi:hypothetical protein